jgi:hypothetical protein
MKGGEKRMKKTILATLLALALVLIPAGSAFAAPVTTATVTITMGGGEINISVAPNWNLGLVVQGGVYTQTGFVLTNGSTNGLSIDVTITGADTANWFLQNAPGNDIYTLSYDNSGSWTAITTGGDPYLSGWTAPDTSDFDLQLEAPNPMNTWGAQNTTVTFDAVQTP